MKTQKDGGEFFFFKNAKILIVLILIWRITKQNIKRDRNKSRMFKNTSKMSINGETVIFLSPGP